jgi:hypothetical protein
MMKLLMQISLWLCIAVGLVVVSLSIRAAPSANGQAALGVFLIFIGLNGFVSLRVTKLEEMLKEMKEKNEK